MTSGRVLVVSDDRELIEPLVQRLGRAGYAVRRARGADDALALVRQDPFDLVVVDTDRDGAKLCRALQALPKGQRVGVVVIGERGAEAEAAALELGADDYLARPVSLDVLLARVRAQLRVQSGRTRAEEEDLPTTRLVFGKLVIDGPRHEVTVEGAPVAFTATEFRLLHFLASSPGRVFTRAHLLGSVVGDHTGVIDRNVDVHVAVIRRKLGPHRRLLETVRGVGYRFQRVSRV
jgi:two-component system alkaline phosphatase synthesis response regulator PhoP